MPAQSSNQSETITLFQWEGINQSATRGLIEDQELYWLENMIPTAPGHLRTAWGPSAPIYTAPGTTQILRIFFTNITGSNPSGFMFLSDGTVDRVDLNSGAVAHLGQIWQPVAPHFWAALKLWTPNQFGNTAGQVGGVVIGSPQGLYAVDGNDTVTAPGQTAPLWLTDDNAGIPMPSGLPGIYALEVYQERLWVMGQTVISFSAPSNGADFSTAGGGGSFPYHGDQLTVSYTDLKAVGGFLYVFGDSCVQVISYLTLSGQGTVTAPYTTTFLYSNVDPQNGQRFFRHVGVWSIALATWNGAGIFLLAGQSPMQVISEKIINLLATLDTAPFEPTTTACDVFGQRWMLFNGTFKDPWGVSRSMLLCWNGKIWTVASQNLNLTHIGAWEQNSCIIPYGTDGQSLYRLFAQPDSNLKKHILTKAYRSPHLLMINNWKRVFCEMHDETHGPEGVTVIGKLHTNGGNVPNGAQSVSYQLPPGTWDTLPHPTEGFGLSAALDLESLSPDFVMERIYFDYEERVRFGA